MNNAIGFVEQIKNIVKDTIYPILKNYPRIVSARVISATDRLAIVRMPYAEDDSNDFQAYIVTSQLISTGDIVNVAYWSNLSTAVVLSNTSTIAAPGGGDLGNYNKLENKPSINSVTIIGNKTPSDFGLYGEGNEPPYPVSSVNSKTGAVVLSASDVGALPDTTVIPTKTSELTNDSGFLTSANTVNGKSIADNPVLTATDVNALPNTATINGKYLSTSPSLTAADVGALPDSTVIPTKTSQLANDSGYLTGENTINGKSLADNPSLTATDVGALPEATEYVSYGTQQLTDAQKEQARTNIGAGTSSFDGNYNSLTNTPEITQTLGTSTDKIPSEKAVSDAIASAGGGDMLKSTYDADGAVANAGGIPDYVKMFMPSGAIVMWSGAASAIPSGFVLCNGSNGTPNLVDRFIIGGNTSGVIGSFGKVDAGPQIEYYSLCYIMKT